MAERMVCKDCNLPIHVGSVHKCGGSDAHELAGWKAHNRAGGVYHKTEFFKGRELSNKSRFANILARDNRRTTNGQYY